MSASPAPSTDSQSAPKAQEQILFRFCRECSNMLYPKEDKMTYKLMFACRTCQYSEEAQSSCVFRNNMYNTVGETAGVTQDVGSDPTVCHHHFHLPLPPDEDLALFASLEICPLCGNVLLDEDEETQSTSAEIAEKREDRNECQDDVRSGSSFAWLSTMEDNDDMDIDEEGEDEKTA